MTSISQSLIEWYSRNKRDLPWRETKNPYNIWVSEIILQQTRVNQGLNYYNKFIKRFPGIEILANTDIDILLKLWQGLGYYSRARNMHFTAKEIVNKYNGEFPENYQDLLKLKGIGDYTASAIASISFNKRTPVLDGNVFRVISRLFGIYESTQTNNGKKHFKNKLLELIPQENPGTFNQAIMEFGALQCIPVNPDCNFCPLSSSCFAFNNDVISKLPVKKQKVKQKQRFFNYLYIINNNNTYVEKRTQNDIWKLLYQFPLIETKTSKTLDELTNTKEWKSIFKGVNLEIDSNFKEKKHILSHQKLLVRFYKINIDKESTFLKNNYTKIKVSKLHTLGVPILIDKYLKDVNK